MNYEPFYERCSQLNLIPQRVTLFTSRVDEVFGDSQQFQDKSAVRTLFRGKTGQMGKAKFYYTKKIMVEFYKWLFEQGLASRAFVDYVSSIRYADVTFEANELDFFYFESLKSALAFVKQVGQSKGMGDEDDLLFIKSMLVLSWHSVDVNEMVDIKKSDLDMANKSVRVSGENSRTIKFEPEDFLIIKRFANTDYHSGFPTMKKQVYLTSKYLFRSPRQVHMTVNSMYCNLRRFNVEAARYGRELRTQILKKNGMFCHILANESKVESLSKFISQTYNTDKETAFGYAGIYRAWKERYYKNT